MFVKAGSVGYLGIRRPSGIVYSALYRGTMKTMFSVFSMVYVVLSVANEINC